jgi:hypothetical protein
MSDAELEFWLMKIGADGLVRITRRPSGEGLTGSWVSANEAERLVLAEWGFNPRLPLSKIEGLRDHLVALRRSCKRRVQRSTGTRKRTRS